MSAVFMTFAAALLLGLILTPLAGRFGRAFGLMDYPQDRKVHTVPVPRCGGLALFLAFFLALVLAWLTKEPQTRHLFGDRQTWAVFTGGLFIFLVGLADDRFSLPAKYKFLAQLVAASICFFGGVKIAGFHLEGLVAVEFDFYSYGLTVFWFVLFINAINIIDGLDGLAAGVVFFVCAVQAVLAHMRLETGTSVFFAAMAGTTLGFLRYNFNPASIFLGDGGSYFLGYMMAALSILSSVKSQVGATMLMPILAFGVPLLDTITSPLRRFVRGQNMFQPDSQHVHHNLIAKGWSQRKTVVFLYLVTAFLAVMAVLIVNMRDVPAGLFILVLGGALILFVRKAGYFSYFAMDKIFGWIRDISDEAGMSHGRRTFLNLQIEISQSATIEEMWENIRPALERLRFDLAELIITPKAHDSCAVPPSRPRDEAGEIGRMVFEWSRPDLAPGKEDFLCSRALLKLELPLMGKTGQVMGSLWLVKSLADDQQIDFTLRRVEHLRRTVVSTLEKLQDAP
jgi:UDP-GlcNAc:undecaprenyl-phosphate GlcNAc-1-phosphate transferase